MRESISLNNDKNTPTLIPSKLNKLTVGEFRNIYKFIYNKGMLDLIQNLISKFNDEEQNNERNSWISYETNFEKDTQLVHILSIEKIASQKFVLDWILKNLPNLDVKNYEIHENHKNVIIKIYLKEESYEEDYYLQYLDNIKITKTLRNLYRNIAIVQINGIKNYKELNVDFFNLENNMESFIRYSCEPDSYGLTITRYWIQLWHDRADLQKKFPQPHSRDQNEYISWITTYALLEDLVPREDFLINKTICSAHQVTNSKFVYIGYLNAVNGLGEAARNNIQILNSLGIKPTTISYNRIQGASLSDRCVCKSPYIYNFRNKVIFIHLNPDNLENFFNDFNRINKYNNYLIFIWAWEFENPSFLMRKYVSSAHEIWGVSSFVSESIKKISGNLNVNTFLHYLESESSETIPRNERDYVLTMADLNSVIDRKNLKGNIEAYSKSNLPKLGIKLIIKTTNLNEHRTDATKIRFYIDELSKDIDELSKNIEIVDGNLTKHELRNLYSNALFYLSLHRSEGFGLNILNSQKFGTPTIVTAYSGNLDFCNPINSYLVNFRLIDIDAKNAAFFGHQKWAEPDINHAIELINDLVSLDSKDYNEKSKKIKNIFDNHNSFEIAKKQLSIKIKKTEMLFWKFYLISLVFKILAKIILPIMTMPYKIKFHISKRIDRS